MLYFQAKSILVVHVTYILSHLDKALAFEWISQSLDKKKFKLSFILLHTKETELERYFKKNNIPFQRIKYKNKLDFPMAMCKCAWQLLQWKSDMVHCHLLDAGLVGLTASWIIRLKKRIYTRHYSSFLHVYFPNGVWYDRYFNALATDIIAISRIVKEILIDWEKASPQKVHLVYHGFQWNDLENVGSERINQIRAKYRLGTERVIIGVISRFVDWKGIQYIIPAFKEIHAKFPNTQLLLANAAGPFENEIQVLLDSLPEESYRKIAFENDLGGLYGCLDVLVHTPIDAHSEAFGQVYVEALALGKPSIFSPSGIANDILAENKWILSVPFQETQAIASRLEHVLSNLKEYKSIYCSHAPTFKSQFSLEKMISSLEKIYSA